ncbi:MAG: VWA domain-containing protein [Deferribacteraceae bacterium]|jgi:uncharacterized protein YegL|nr:VWA domain-containing protein [Deferribacteraceae bacterium]
MRRIIKLILITFLLSLFSCSVPVPEKTAETSGEESSAADKDVYAKESEAPPVSASAPLAETKDSAGSVSRLAAPSIPARSGLKAAFADDNEQFNAYLEFLEKYKSVPQINFPVKERIIFKITDETGAALPDAAIKVSAGSKELMTAKTVSDGLTLFFPSEYKEDAYRVSASYNGVSKDFTAKRGDRREQILKLPVKRKIPAAMPADILFVLDTTGSMGEEIERLKSTLLIIHENLQAFPFTVNIRFGMVMFKDRGDSYITQTIPFTSDVKEFQKTVSKVSASGGGDTPEDMQTALQAALTGPKWIDSGAKLIFLITDAPAHIDYGQQFTLLESAKLARAKGIRIHSVGTGGLSVEGEINLRQSAQYTMGKYIFLTYGERGESEGGAPGSVSHHTGENYTSDKLETIIIRFAKEDIAAYSGKPLEEKDDYFEASDGKDGISILKELFSSMVAQLASYSPLLITRDTTAAVIPLDTTDKTALSNAEYFTDQLYFAAAEYKGWKSVERKDLQKILNEIKFNLSGLADEASIIKLGELSGAKLLITGSVYIKDDAFEIYLKLIDAETGETLSVTRGKADKRLGIK